jgi:hypothetical protein
MKKTLIALMFLSPVATFAISTGTETYPVKDKTYTTTYDKTKTTATYDKTKTTATYDKLKTTPTTMTDSEKQQRLIELQTLISQLLQQLINLLQAQQKTLGQ